MIECSLGAQRGGQLRPHTCCRRLSSASESANGMRSLRTSNAGPAPQQSSLQAETPQMPSQTRAWSFWRPDPVQVGTLR